MIRIIRYAGIGLLALALVGGCGGDDAPAGAGGDNGKKKTAATGKKKTGKQRKKKKNKDGELFFYRRVEDVAGSEKAGLKLRLDSRPNRFLPDPTGLINRDPFFSFVLGQRPDTPTVKDENGDNTGPKEAACRQHAPNPKSKDPGAQKAYSYKDLRLQGIIRGRRRIALFQDGAGYVHNVRQGDCIGKEKVRVARISSDRVELEIVVAADAGSEEKVEVRFLDPSLQGVTGDNG